MNCLNSCLGKMLYKIFVFLLFPYTIGYNKMSFDKYYKGSVMKKCLQLFSIFLLSFGLQLFSSEIKQSAVLSIIPGQNTDETLLRVALSDQSKLKCFFIPVTAGEEDTTLAELHKKHHIERTIDFRSEIPEEITYKKISVCVFESIKPHYRIIQTVHSGIYFDNDGKKEAILASYANEIEENDVYKRLVLNEFMRINTFPSENSLIFIGKTPDLNYEDYNIEEQKKYQQEKNRIEELDNELDFSDLAKYKNKNQEEEEEEEENLHHS